MICYRLRCANHHEFEGWYKDSATFAMLGQKGLLSCPECGTADVEQAPMAPAIVRHGRGCSVPEEQSAVDEARTEAPPAPVQPTQPVRPDAVLSALRDVRRMIEDKCENMGKNFADEALRIHHGEAPERGIYGEMSETQREMLEDEGVEFHNIPWVRDTDS
ncbi:DUF1178 family protein [Acetobacter okinawensis]|uniref:DUF1178 family protein n=1 Tax=Acetobacter okinawensis TaxID=1076594 RepID=UPI001BA486E8|nr:DUF1178 family protein [Acetobacter okinawensis]MBS0964931.1 DUF1178 family protein [Acetobacter okinawensis]